MSDIKRLTRSSSDKMFLGVCGGLAAYFDGVDSTLIRVIWVILSIMSIGFGGLLAYLLCALIIPLDSKVN